MPTFANEILLLLEKNSVYYLAFMIWKLENDETNKEEWKERKKPASYNASLSSFHLDTILDESKKCKS